MTKGLRTFYVGPDEQAIRSGEAVEIMASSHEEAMEKGLALHAKGLLSLSDFLDVELYVTDGEKSITYVLELTDIDDPD